MRPNGSLRAQVGGKPNYANPGQCQNTYDKNGEIPPHPGPTAVHIWLTRVIGFFGHFNVNGRGILEVRHDLAQSLLGQQHGAKQPN